MSSSILIANQASDFAAIGHPSSDNFNQSQQLSLDNNQNIIISPFTDTDCVTVAATAAAIVAAATVLNQNQHIVSAATTTQSQPLALASPPEDPQYQQQQQQQQFLDSVQQSTAQLLSMPVYPTNTFDLPQNIMSNGYGNIDNVASTATTSNSAAGLSSVSAPNPLLEFGAADTNAVNAAAAAAAAATSRYTSQATTPYAAYPTVTAGSPPHPMTLHPPIQPGSASGMPFGFGSAVNAIAVTAAGLSSNMAAASSGYFGGWPLQWPANGSSMAATTATSPLVTSSNSHLMGFMSNNSSGWTTTGTQRPRLTTTLWEDEGTICYQVDAESVCVARRQDNNMINGTKLLNVVGMTRGKRDGILKNEKQRVVVKVGAMHLKGVWIPFERAKALAEHHGISDKLYPLFAEDPNPHLLQHPPTATGVTITTTTTPTPTTRLRANTTGSINTNDPMQTMANYDLSILNANGNPMMRRSTAAQITAPSFGHGYPQNSTGTLSPDGLTTLDTSLVYPSSSSTSSTARSVTSAMMNGLTRRASITSPYGSCYSTDATDMTAVTTTGMNGNNGVTTVLGAGGSHATWSPLTPSMDARPYYGDATTTTDMAVHSGANPYTTANSMSIHYRDQQPTSPSAVVYANSKKRSSDYLTAGSQQLSSGSTHTAAFDATEFSGYDATTTALHISPRIGNAALMGTAPNNSTTATYGAYTNMPLSPATSPSAATFDGQSMERTYSEVEDRPARKRSRVSVSDAAQQPPTPTSNNDMTLKGGNNIRGRSTITASSSSSSSAAAATAHPLKSLTSGALVDPIMAHGGNGNNADDDGYGESFGLPGLDTNGQRTATGFTTGDSSTSSTSLVSVRGGRRDNTTATTTTATTGDYPLASLFQSGNHTTTTTTTSANARSSSSALLKEEAITVAANGAW